MNMRNFSFILTAAAFACLCGGCISVAPREFGKKEFTPSFVERCRMQAEEGDPNAQALYGKALLYGWGVASNHVAAVEYLDKAAKAGNVIGLASLGWCYESGLGVGRDMDKAASLYFKAAGKGNVWSQYSLANCYSSGKGVKRDYNKAYYWYSKAAKKGLAEAQNSLGLCYKYGLGVEKSPSKAAKWFMKAADQRFAPARYNLGFCYFEGSGVKENRERAVQLWFMAVEQGYDAARAKLFDLALDEDPFAMKALQDLSTKIKAVDTSWRDGNTERFWNEVSASATRTSTAPRLAGADAQAGEYILKAFGTKYLPLAYGRYQVTRKAALEREQNFQESTMDKDASNLENAEIYDKMVKATAKVVSEMYRRHDELCHFYLLQKAGIVTDVDLGKVDSAKVCVMLPAVGSLIKSSGSLKRPTDAERAFALENMPLALAAYDHLASELEKDEAVYAGLLSEAVRIDAVRGDGVLKPLRVRLADIRLKLGDVVNAISQNNLSNVADVVTAEQLAKLDQQLVADLLKFEKTLPVQEYARKWFSKNWTEKERWDVAFREAPVLGLIGSMQAIEDKGYAMCRYEVTQGLWEAVMGENPSHFKGSQLPVENVTWDDCQVFLAKLNSLPDVQSAGLRYRLPLESEWRYACSAGAKERYGNLAGGIEVTDETFGDVAWNTENSNGRTHPVGGKKPNAFGLFDMHGNVWELTSSSGDYRGRKKVSCGGSWNNYPSSCAVEESYDVDHSSRHYNIMGLRLAL